MASRRITANEISHLRTLITNVGICVAVLLGVAVASASDCGKLNSQQLRKLPTAPKPEPVVITELPLPPTAPSDAVGSCSLAINPHKTGCISGTDHGIFEGPSYAPDGKHVFLPVEFTGAPDSPDPASIYTGHQVIAIKTDGKLFPNGDPWKCITCGVPEENKRGANTTREHGAGYIEGGIALNRPKDSGPINVLVDHPQPFPDGKRMIAGTNVVECGPYIFTDAVCTPEKVHIYPIRWNMSADGTGAGGNMRELRLNPDGIHLGWNHFAFGPEGVGEFTGFGTLVFNPAPKGGTPQVARYDLERVTLLINTSPEFHSFLVDPKNPGVLLHNTPRGVIGEFRGWSSDGKSALGMSVEESGNFDLYETSLATGESKRITSDPAYTDPVKMSPDDRWSVMMDIRPYNRHMWYAGMQGIPPLTDTLTMSISAYAWRIGNRRFFQPILLDGFAERGSYHGQQLNAGPGTKDSPSDPNWNGRADPTWSPDGTNVVYWQALVTAPDCGRDGLAPCPTSSEPGGRRTRLMIAHLTSRKPLPIKRIAPVNDVVPWGIPYRPGDKTPPMPGVTYGKFKLNGRVSGFADVEIREADSKRGPGFIGVSYASFSDDGEHIINGTESVQSKGGLMGDFVWHSDLKLSGCESGSKVTSEPEGFKVTGGMLSPLRWTGTLSTTINGKTYVAPAPGN